MFKYILLVAIFFAAVFSQSTCPSTLINKCETEIQKGTNLIYLSLPILWTSCQGEGTRPNRRYQLHEMGFDRSKGLLAMHLRNRQETGLQDQGMRHHHGNHRNRQATQRLCQLIVHSIYHSINQSWYFQSNKPHYRLKTLGKEVDLCYDFILSQRVKRNKKIKNY